MKQTLFAALLCVIGGAANANLTLSGGSAVTFGNYDAPPVLTSPQSSGLENALIGSDIPSEIFNVTFLGKEAGHINEFWVNGNLVFNNLASVPSTYGSFIAGNPLTFAFRDVADSEIVANGGIDTPLSSFASYVVLGSFVDDMFNPYRGQNNEFTFVLGFNDGSISDADYDDLVVGVTAVPEPSTYALMIAGLGVIGYISRRRRNS